MDVQKIFHISEQEDALWKEVEEMTNASISSTISELLTTKLEQLKESKKARDGQCSSLVVSYKDNEGFNRKVTFVGRWLVQDYSENGVDYSVAFTEKERFFVLTDDRRGGGHFVFDTFQDMYEAQYPAELMAKIHFGDVCEEVSSQTSSCDDISSLRR